MADREGPWGREGEVAPQPARKPPASGRGRLLAWLGLMAAVGAGVVLLFRAFPGTVSSVEDKAWLARSLGILVLVSAGLLVPGRTNLRQMLRHGAIWAGIILVLVLGATYSEELMGVAGRVKAKFSGAYPVATAARELVVTQDAGGGFYVMGKVNGGLVRFLVDTGATDTVLTPDDARRVGIETAGLRFNQSAETANGTGYGAAYTADSVEVGSIRFTDVPVTINQAPMSNSLLGMSFLKRLESFQVQGDRLYLKARE